MLHSAAVSIVNFSHQEILFCEDFVKIFNVLTGEKQWLFVDECRDLIVRCLQARQGIGVHGQSGDEAKHRQPNRQGGTATIAPQARAADKKRPLPVPDVPEALEVKRKRHQQVGCHVTVFFKPLTCCDTGCRSSMELISIGCT